MVIQIVRTAPKELGGRGSKRCLDVTGASAEPAEGLGRRFPSDRPRRSRDPSLLLSVPRQEPARGTACSPWQTVSRGMQRMHRATQQKPPRSVPLRLWFPNTGVSRHRRRLECTSASRPSVIEVAVQPCKSELSSRSTQCGRPGDRDTGSSVTPGSLVSSFFALFRFINHYVPQNTFCTLFCCAVFHPRGLRALYTHY